MGLQKVGDTVIECEAQPSLEVEHRLPVVLKELEEIDNKISGLQARKTKLEAIKALLQAP